MDFDLTNRLVVGISSRSLFDLERENEIFVNEGLEAYTQYQLENEDRVLEPGAAFGLVKGLLSINDAIEGEPAVEVVVMSKNNADCGLRIFHSVEHHGLNITRAAFTSGRPLAHYLGAFSVDLFLSRSLKNVQVAGDAGFASAQIYPHSPDATTAPVETIRMAFDADAVLFSEESERIYREHGLDAFNQNERENARRPLSEGPFAQFLKSLSRLQKRLPLSDGPLRTAIVTARDSPAHERIVRTLRDWGVRIDESFFLGGLSKESVLEAFGAHIFFDDQHRHVEPASRVVPSGLVPYRSDSPLQSIPPRIEANGISQEAANEADANGGSTANGNRNGNGNAAPADPAGKTQGGAAAESA